MRIVSKSRVYLEKGETVPAFCTCGKIYQPPKGSLSSICPKCGRVNMHEDQEAVRWQRGEE